MTAGCTDCHHLSDAYNEATKRYLALIRARQLSSLEHEAQEIDALLIATDRERTEARNALSSHERQRHRESARPSEEFPSEASPEDRAAPELVTAGESGEQPVLVCQRQEELAAEVQRHLQRLIELAHAETQAVAVRAENLMMELDKQIERTIGQKERAMGALCAHRHDHGC